MKVVKWTDWFNLLERRGAWEHWMNSAGPEQERYGYWLDTTTSAKYDDRFQRGRQWGVAPLH